ncbi:MAG: chloramphenicol-sensitive protein RarD [Nocardioidaceae bacterium]|nr:chloramphenicol-sensitive protein RarD [Nocardioidaceae bacterium]
MSEARKGLLFGLAAYGLWGAFPLYWPLLEPAGATELLAHRISWSAVVMVLLVLAARRTVQLRSILRSPRQRGLLATAAVVISVNWGVFIWGVNNGHVVETSLGYFMNPLVTVLFGVLLLGERLRRLQWAALALAGAAVLGLAVDYGRPPWVALILAFSFGTYGLLKKKAGVGAIEGLTVETLVVAPVAVCFLVWLGATGRSHALEDPPWHLLLLSTSGIVTALPLIFFGAAAIRVPLTTLGLLQYVAPTLQFMLGVFFFHEPMPPARWLGFVVIWVALALFSADSMRRRQLTRMQVEASAV